MDYPHVVYRYFSNRTSVLKRVMAVVAIVALLLPTKLLAWGQNGHRIVAQIADGHLTRTTQQALDPLLDGDLLPEVSTWADEMKSSPEDFWQSTANPWHYINFNDMDEFAQMAEGVALPFKKAPTNVYEAIFRCVSVLQSETSNLEDKRLYFRFLVHLIGDVHQPMHAGRGEDRGGNDIRVQFFGETTDLHTLWDTQLIEYSQLSFSEYARFIETQDSERIQEIVAGTPADWVAESFTLREQIYDIGNGDYRWDYPYKYKASMDERLLQAGIRLAGVLNAIYDPEARVRVDAFIPRNQ